VSFACLARRAYSVCSPAEATPTPKISVRVAGGGTAQILCRIEGSDLRKFYLELMGQTRTVALRSAAEVPRKCRVELIDVLSISNQGMKLP
jgi:hypothetical protein